MDYIVYRMDNFIIHLDPLPRRFPLGVAPQSLGYMSRKREVVRNRFETFNFSVILSGGGFLTLRGQTVAVEAPCVITQWPGEETCYGPSGEWSEWEELYMMFSADQLPLLRERRLAETRKPIWQVRRPSRMLDQWHVLHDLLPRVGETGVVDRVDRACEMMLVESRLGERRPPGGRDETAIREIRSHIRSRLGMHHDFDALALAHGLSPATFRRHWARHVREPPARYLMTLRMREACRLLVESDESVASIAAQLGFEDPLYFSRRFAALFGMPATAYRRRHAVAG